MSTAINAQSPSAPRQVRHSDYILNLRLPRTVTEIMVFEEIIRHSPRRRASPCIAEGFSPAASAVERNIFSISISPTASAVERNIFSISISPTARSVEQIIAVPIEVEPIGQG